MVPHDAGQCGVVSHDANRQSDDQIKHDDLHQTQDTEKVRSNNPDRDRVLAVLCIDRRLNLLVYSLRINIGLLPH